MMDNGELYSAYNFVVEQNMVWFVPQCYGLLIGYSLIENRVVRIEEIPDALEIPLAFADIKKMGGKIYLVPTNARNLISYDIEERKFDIFDMGLEDKEVVGNKYISAELYGNCIYLFPGKEKAILKIDLETKEVMRIKGWQNAVDDDAISYFQFDSACCENKVWLLVRKTSRIMCFDMKTDSYEFIDIECNNDTLSTIEFISENIFVAFGESGNVYIIDLNTNQTKRVENNIENFLAHRFEKNRAAFSDSFRIGNKVLVLPGQGNMILCLDLDTECLTSMEKCHKEILEYKINGTQFSRVAFDDNYAYFFWIKNRLLIKCDLRDGKLQHFAINMKNCEEEIVEQLTKIYTNGKVIIRENEAPCSTLNEWIKMFIL